MQFATLHCPSAGSQYETTLNSCHTVPVKGKIYFKIINFLHDLVKYFVDDVRTTFKNNNFTQELATQLVTEGPGPGGFVHAHMAQSLSVSKTNTQMQYLENMYYNMSKFVLPYAFRICNANCLRSCAMFFFAVANAIVGICGKASMTAFAI